jgi:hypothetical protein
MPHAVSPVLPNSPIRLIETVIAKDDPQYNHLSTVVGLVGVEEDILVTSRWKFTLKERLAVLFGGSIWIQVMTFGSFKPIKILTKEPPYSECL